MLCRYNGASNRRKIKIDSVQSFAAIPPVEACGLYLRFSSVGLPAGALLLLVP